MLKIICTQGMTKGDEFQVAEGDMMMGRSESNDILILDARSSRVHACLSTKNGTTTLVDQKSKNGLVVNEKKLDGQIIIKPGDLICVGHTVFEVFSSVEEAGKPQSTGFVLPKPRSKVVPTSKVQASKENLPSASDDPFADGMPSASDEPPVINDDMKTKSTKLSIPKS